MQVIRPRTIADMAIFLADAVPELSDDELCRAALRKAGVPAFFVTRDFETVRNHARTARAAAAELWSLRLWK
jgi:hypothetical protein